MTDLDLADDVRRAIRARRPDDIAPLASTLSPHEWAGAIARLNPPEIAVLVQWLPDELIPRVLGELEPETAAAILRRLSRQDAADYLEAMAPDEAADAAAELPGHELREILTVMEPAEARELRELMAYPPETAGGVMSPAFVAIAPDVRADQAIVALRAVSAASEIMSYVYVLDDEEHLLGVLPFHRLVLEPPMTRVRDFMVLDPVTVPVEADQEAAARLLTRHNLLALPVVDAENHLLGVITADDVADILEEEATADIEQLGGSQPLDKPYLQAGVLLLVRRRIVWLLLLFVAEAYTGTVLRAYDAEIAKVVALSYFIPLLIGTGGNVGSQVTTTLVRAIGLGEVRLRDAGRVLAKEVAAGLILGVVMAAVAFGRAELLGTGMQVSLVVAGTIAAITLWAAAVASVLPLILRKVGVDPAVVSAPFITTLVDGTGLVIYFSIAKFVLNL